MVYKSCKVKDLYAKTKYLMDNSEKRREIGKNAYLTLEQQWNPENAANRLYELSVSLLNSGSADIFEEGVCSKAKRLKDNWL